MDIQVKEVMDNINSRVLSETAVIKAELQSTGAVVKNIN